MSDEDYEMSDAWIDERNREALESRDLASEQGPPEPQSDDMGWYLETDEVMEQPDVQEALVEGLRELREEPFRDPGTKGEEDEDQGERP